MNKENLYLIINIQGSGKTRKIKHIISTLPNPFSIGREELDELYVEDGSGIIEITPDNLILHSSEEGVHYRGMSRRPISPGDSFELTTGDIMEWGKTRLRFTFKEPPTMKFLRNHLAAKEYLKERYGELSLVGSGNVSSVYIPKSSENTKPKAIKVLSVEIENPQIITQFCCNASISLSHPSLIPIYKVIKEPNIKLFALEMEYCPEEPLQYIIGIKGKLTFSKAYPLFIKILQAINYLHQNKIIHRNLSPSNILMADIPKLLGMSLIKDENNPITFSRATVVTPNFTAPEQIRDPAGVNAKADIFSLGAMWYTTLTGQPPFGAENPSEYLENLKKNIQPVPLEAIIPEISSEFCKLIERMMSVNPENRPRDIEMILDVLEHIV